MGFTIEDADVFVRQLPVSGAESLWFPAHNPLITTLRRVDDNISATSNNGGNTQITVGTGGVVAVDSLVFINTVYAGGSIEAVYTVLSVVDPTNFVIDLPWNGVAESGYLTYNSDYTNYYFLIRLMKYDDNDNLVVIGTQKEYPFTNGMAYPDISAMVKKTVGVEDSYDYVAINEADRSLSSRLVLDVSEFYSGTKKAFDPTVTQNIFGVNAALQVNSAQGANMAEYVTEPSGQDLAKFLTTFNKPTAWVGLPFDMQFIFSELLAAEINASPPNINFLRTRELFDPNDGIVTAFTETMDLTQYYYVNRVQLRSAVNPTVNSAVARTIDFSIRSTDGSNVVRTITETKTIKIIQTLPCNAIYLKWLNTNGGWEYWCFSHNQTNGMIVKGGEQFTKFIMPTATGFPIIGREEKNWLKKDATPTLVIGADGLDDDDLGSDYFHTGIIGITYSPKVMMLMNPDEFDAVSSPTVAPQWLTVYVDVGTFKFKETNETKFKVEMNIQLTEIEVQSL